MLKTICKRYVNFFCFLHRREDIRDEDMPRQHGNWLIPKKFESSRNWITKGLKVGPTVLVNPRLMAKILLMQSEGVFTL